MFYLDGFIANRNFKNILISAAKYRRQKKIKRMSISVVADW
jgi:hypothetical protein